jgi:hypothetical protein
MTVRNPPGEPDFFSVNRTAKEYSVLCRKIQLEILLSDEQMPGESTRIRSFTS